jgi:L-threonylcarbamoyladenylate synthase
VAEQLGEKIPYILDGGPCQIGIESTIIGFEDQDVIVYRLGGMELEFIENIIGKVKRTPASSSNPKAPGLLKSHYAPVKPVVIGNLNELLRKYDSNNLAILSFHDHFPQIESKRQVVLSESGSVNEAAKNLFASLRYLDGLPVEIILAEYIPDNGLGRAVNDRLKRASAK